MIHPHTPQDTTSLEVSQLRARQEMLRPHTGMQQQPSSRDNTCCWKIIKNIRKHFASCISSKRRQLKLVFKTSVNIRPIATGESLGYTVGKFNCLVGNFPPRLYVERYPAPVYNFKKHSNIGEDESQKNKTFKLYNKKLTNLT